MRYEAAVTAIVAAVPNVVAVYLFGSRARGDPRESSDVDLALLGTKPLDAVARFELQEKIAAILHCSVDLVDLRAASTVMRVEVLRDALLLHEGEASERALFEATALAAYARLHEERRMILEDIERIGRVHG